MGQATALACLVSGVLSGPLKDGDPLGDEFLLLYEADSRVLPGGGLVVPLQSQSRLYRLSVRAPYAEPIRMMNSINVGGWVVDVHGKMGLDSNDDLDNATLFRFD